MAINPYPTGPVVGANFVGRENLVSRLVCSLTEEHDALHIQGLPGVGKSSLASEVVRKIRNLKRDDIQIIEVSLSCFNNEESVLRHITSELGVVASNGSDYFSNLQASLHTVAAAGKWVLMVVDEFDAVRSFQPEYGGKLFIQRLRTLLDDRQNGLCVLVLSRRSIYDIETQLPGISNLAGRLDSQYLKPFSDAEFQSMLDLSKKVSTDDDKSSLRELVGQHPRLMGLVLREAHYLGSVVEAAAVKRASVYEIFEEVWSFLGSCDLQNQLAQNVIGPYWEKKAMRRLMLDDYGIINGLAVSKAFQLFLEEKTVSQPVWPIWSECEISLRRYIERHLKLKNPKWTDVLKENKTFLAIQKQMEERMALEKRLMPYATPADSPLDYAHPYQLWELIDNYWDAFKDDFSPEGPKSDWSKKFETLATVRGPNAHNREIDRNLRAEVIRICQQLIRIIKKCQHSQESPAG